MTNTELFFSTGDTSSLHANNSHQTTSEHNTSSCVYDTFMSDTIAATGALIRFTAPSLKKPSNSIDDSDFVHICISSDPDEEFIDLCALPDTENSDDDFVEICADNDIK